MGADPEFNLMVLGNRVSAYQVLRTTLGESRTSGPGFPTPGGQLGWDGCDATGEIRPKPAGTPEELVDNIYKIFKTYSNKLDFFDFSTLSLAAPVGGHIHLSLADPGEIAPSERETAIMHKYLASFYLPLFLGENSFNLNLRLKTNYGRLGDYRVDRKGETFCYEFRCPSAEWLTTKKTAMATLAYIATVYHEIKTKPERFKKMKGVIYSTNSQGNALQDLVVDGYKPIAQSLTNEIKKQIKTFTLYPRYKKEIDFILSPSKVLADKAKANYNILAGWGLTSPKKTSLSLKTVLSNKSTIAPEGIDLNQIARNLDFIVNDDLNVATLAEVLANRVVSLKWKLKHRYIFFGLRKGISNYYVANAKQEYLIGAENLKTIEDINTMASVMGKMFSRYDRNFRPTLSFDPTTGTVKKIKVDPKQIIAVGIPYADREKLNTKEFLRTIYLIEKGLSPVTPTPIEAKGDQPVNNEVTDAYNKKEDISLHPDHESQGARLAQNATEELLNEIDHGTRIEPVDPGLIEPDLATYLSQQIDEIINPDGTDDGSW